MEGLKRFRRLRGRQGTTLIEVLIAVVMLSLALVGLSAAGVAAAAHVQMGRASMARWAALQHQMESLLSQGYGNVSDSSTQVLGYPMEWTVTGTDPQKITLSLERETFGGRVVRDTVVMYLLPPEE